MDYRVQILNPTVKENEKHFDTITELLEFKGNLEFPHRSQVRLDDSWENIDEDQDFYKWCDEMEKYLWDAYMITIGDCTDLEEMRVAFDGKETPVEFVEWKADKYDLQRVSD